ncbi:MAG TPA: hypothetical protein VED84_03500 [Acidimicrobiales bacterium]|nr:hypothetical protein [Acidimicrobiales bacterium]
MTQPRYAPIAIEDEVRPGYRLGPPRPWTADRPADFRANRPVSGRGTGSAGPDQGFALLLAERLAHRIVAEPGERREDILAGAVAIALRRASLLGRAPVSVDIECALDLFGYRAPAPPELVEFRRSLFDGVSHDYWAQRALANRIPESTLRLTIPEIDASAAEWRDLLRA